MSEQLKTEIAAEVAANKILVYGKGTKRAALRLHARNDPVFQHFGYPFEVVNVLENMPKRERARRDDRLADVAEGLHQRPVLRRYRHPRTDGAERRVANRCSRETFGGEPHQADDPPPLEVAFTTLVDAATLASHLDDRHGLWSIAAMRSANFRAGADCMTKRISRARSLPMASAISSAHTPARTGSSIARSACVRCVSARHRRQRYNPNCCL